MGIAIFLFMNLAVIPSAFLLNYKVLRFNSRVDSLSSLFILYFAQIVLTELILGAFNILELANIIVFNLLILITIYILTKNKQFPFSFNKAGELISIVKNDKVILLGICAILGFGLVKISINLFNPPFGWDSLNYHFTFAVEWLKHKNLNMPITVFDDPSPSYYPINGSLFFFWLIAPLKNVFLADLGQVPFFMLAFLAVYSIARKINLDKTESLFAACLFTLIPNYFKQLEIAYVDVMVSALFLTAVNYLFLIKNEFSPKNVIIYSMAAGLLLGIKTVALPYVFLLIIPFVYLCLKNIAKRGLSALGLSLIIIIILGGFSYIRNLIETGNPLYPLDLRLFGKTVFKGVIDNATYRAHFKIDDYRLGKLFFHEGLGAQTLLFIFPSILLALPLALFKRKRNLDFYFIYFLILPLLLYLVYRYVIPLANTRYLYPLLGIGTIIGFYTFRNLNIPRRALNVLVAVCVLASMAELAGHMELAVSVALTALLFLMLPYLIVMIKKAFTIKKALFFLVLIVASLAMLEKNYLKNEYPRYITMQKYSGFWPDAIQAWIWLNQNTSGDNIAYVGRPVPFPLYGSNFKNNVFYVSLNKTDPARLHYFRDSHYQWGHDFESVHKNFQAKGNYRWGADYQVWKNNLLRRNTDYLFVYSLHQTKDIIFPLEDNWAKVNPDKFMPVFTNQTIHIYKLLK